MQAEAIRQEVRRWLASGRVRRRLIGPEDVQAIQSIAQVRSAGDDGGPGGDGGGIDPIGGGPDSPGGDGQGINPVGPGGRPGGAYKVAQTVILAATVLPFWTRGGGSAQMIEPIGPTDHLDDFSVDSIADYATEGTWEVSGGVLQFTAQGSGPGSLDSWALYKGQQYTDVRVRATVFMANRNPSLILRASSRVSLGNAYGFEFDLGTGLTIKSYAGAATATLFSDPAAVIGNNDIIEARAVGSTLTAYINGVLKATVIDASHATGYVGVGAPNATSPTWDDFTVNVL